MLLLFSAALSAQVNIPSAPPRSVPQASVTHPGTPAPGAMKLTLAEAEQLALKNNPQISRAQYQASAYGQITQEFRAAYFPMLEGNVTAVGADSGSRIAAGALNNSIVYNRVATGVALSQLISDFGRTNSLVASAALGAQAQEQAVNYTKADVIVRTDGAYLAVLRARALRAVAEETVRARQDIVDQVQALLNSKLKSSLDLSIAKVNLADAKLLLSNAENDMRAAEAELTRQLVLPVVTHFDLADPSSFNAPPPDENQLAQQALQMRPDLMERRLQAESERKFARAEDLLSRPSVGLLGAAGYVPAADSPVPGTYGAVGVNVKIPVFNGGLFRARRFEAEARAAAAEKAVQDSELQVCRDVRVAWLDAKNAFDRLDLTQQLLDQARLSLDLAQARYNLGLSSIVELSQSQLQYTSAEIARARAGYDYTAQLSILRFQAGQLP
jgi:outer membrane protein